MFADSEVSPGNAVDDEKLIQLIRRRGMETIAACSDSGDPTKNWQRGLREFLLYDGLLHEELVSSAHKFVNTGECHNVNFALSTLMDMAWGVSVLVLEALEAKRLPNTVVDAFHGDVSFKARYEQLLKKFNECRGNWLEEITALRSMNLKKLKPGESIDDLYQRQLDIFHFVPENALTNEELPYFRAAVEECVKLAVLNSDGAGKEEKAQLQEALLEAEERFEKAEEEIEELRRRLDEEVDRVAQEMKQRAARTNTQHQKELKEKIDAIKELERQLQEAKERSSILTRQLRKLGMTVSDADDDSEEKALEADAEALWHQFNDGATMKVELEEKEEHEKGLKATIHQQEGQLKKMTDELAKLRRSLASEQQARAVEQKSKDKELQDAMKQLARRDDEVKRLSVTPRRPSATPTSSKQRSSMGSKEQEEPRPSAPRDKRQRGSRSSPDRPEQSQEQEPQAGTRPAVQRRPGTGNLLSPNRAEDTPGRPSSPATPARLGGAGASGGARAGALGASEAPKFGGRFRRPRGLPPSLATSDDMAGESAEFDELPPTPAETGGTGDSATAPRRAGGGELRRNSSTVALQTDPLQIIAIAAPTRGSTTSSYEDDTVSYYARLFARSVRLSDDTEVLPKQGPRSSPMPHSVAQEASQTSAPRSTSAASSPVAFPADGRTSEALASAEHPSEQSSSGEPLDAHCATSAQELTSSAQAEAEQQTSNLTRESSVASSARLPTLADASTPAQSSVLAPPQSLPRATPTRAATWAPSRGKASRSETADQVRIVHEQLTQIAEDLQASGAANAELAALLQEARRASQEMEAELVGRGSMQLKAEESTRALILELQAAGSSEREARRRLQQAQEAILSLEEEVERLSALVGSSEGGSSPRHGAHKRPAADRSVQVDLPGADGKSTPFTVLMARAAGCSVPDTDGAAWGDMSASDVALLETLLKGQQRPGSALGAELYPFWEKHYEQLRGMLKDEAQAQDTTFAEYCRKLKDSLSSPALQAHLERLLVGPACGRPRPGQLRNLSLTTKCRRFRHRVRREHPNHVLGELPEVRGPCESEQGDARDRSPADLRQAAPEENIGRCMSAPRLRASGAAPMGAPLGGYTAAAEARQQRQKRQVVSAGIDVRGRMNASPF